MPGTFKPVAGKSAEWNRGAYTWSRASRALRYLPFAAQPDGRDGGEARIHRGRDRRRLRRTCPRTCPPASATGASTTSRIYLKTGSRPGHTPTTFGPMAEVVHNNTRKPDRRPTQGHGDVPEVAAESSPAPPQGRATGLRRRPSHLHGPPAPAQSGGGMPGIFPPLVANGAVIAPDPATCCRRC